MAEETFRLPKSSYDELVKIIQAYGNSGPESALEDVARSAAMDRTAISKNNAFLMSVGIIEGGKAKGITEKGRALSHALQFAVQEDIAQHWRDLVLSNEFLQKMVTAVTIRGGMEGSALQAHIAYSAGEPKSGQAMAGAGAVVEILRVAALVKEVDGKLLADPATLQGISSQPIRTAQKEVGKFTSASSQPKIEATASMFHSDISIQIQIQCSAAEIEGLGPRIRALIKELKEDGPQV
jgi:hypothetical protein